MRPIAHALLLVAALSALSLKAFAQPVSPLTLFEEGKRLRAANNKESLAAAVERFDLAASQFRQSAQQGCQGEALFQLGLSRSALGDYAGALDAYQRALPLRVAEGDRTMAAQILNNIGVLRDYLGEDQLALDFYRRSLAMKRESNQRSGEAATLTNIGMIYASHGEHAQALAYHRQALVLRRKESDPAGVGNVLQNIGLVYQGRGQYDTALRYFQQALQLRRQANDPRGAAHSLASVGMTYASLGQRHKGLSILERALSMKQKLGDRVSEARTLQELGDVHRSLGHPTQALQHYRQALDIRREVGQPGGEASTLASIARVQRDRGQLDQSRAGIEAAIRIVETLRSRLPAPNSRLAFFGSKASYYHFYVDLLMRMHQRQPAAGYDRLAFEAHERARARSLLDLLHESGRPIGEGIDGDLLRRKDALRGRIISAERGRENEEQRQLLLSEAEELEAQIRLQSPRYALLNDPVPLTVNQIQKQVLDNDTVLLEYSLAPERSFLWLVTTDSLRAAELPPEKVIEALARRARELIARSAERRYEHAARLALERLAALILGPIRQSLGRKRLLIVADGALQTVPFCALGGRHPLLADHEIVTAPSASVMEFLRREAAQRTSSTLQIAVLADPHFGGSLQQLPATRREASSIARLIPADQSLIAVGSRASRALALSGELARYRILHFATHASVDDRNPELSGIALSDGMLRMADIYNLSVSAELVVLSACETAGGKPVRGEGLLGLVRGFMYAGAPRVIASLWKVRDEATAQLMTHFYEAMFAGHAPPGAALRQAQMIMSRSSRFRAPAYWAGFVLQGEWQ